GGGAGGAGEPHRVAYYLTELAGRFHPYYKAHRVITDDRALTLARLGLCAAVAQVVRNGLELLGVSAPESMSRAGARDSAVAQTRRRTGAPGFGQWIVLGGAVVVILGLTFTLGMLVGRQLARSNLGALGPSAPEAARRGTATPASRRGGIAAETMAAGVPEPTEKLTCYQTLTEPLGATGAPRSDPSKP